MTGGALGLGRGELSDAEADAPADVFADFGEDSFQCANRLATGTVSADMVHPDDQSGGEKVRNPECNHGIDPHQCAQRFGIFVDLVIRHDEDDGQDKIGRASCRERECQNVEISVVAVYLKKKNIKKKIEY